jgi:hypothetical protein
MMGPMYVLLVGSLAFGPQVPASQATRPRAADSANALVGQGKNRYTQLFRVPQRGAKPQPIPLPQNPRLTRDMQPRVVCGTVVVPVRPDGDAKMIVAPNDTGGPQPEYRIRKIAPTICNE